MRELEIVKNEIEKLRKENKELNETIGTLEYELMLYNTERKEKLLENMNDTEKHFIEFLEEMQNDNNLNDCELSRYKLNNYNMMLEKFYEHIADFIDEIKIKDYFNFDKYNN